jgi:hypothetical protein
MAKGGGSGSVSTGPTSMGAGAPQMAPMGQNPISEGNPLTGINPMSGSGAPTLTGSGQSGLMDGLKSQMRDSFGGPSARFQGLSGTDHQALIQSMNDQIRQGLSGSSPSQPSFTQAMLQQLKASAMGQGQGQGGGNAAGMPSSIAAAGQDATNAMNAAMGGTPYAPGGGAAAAAAGQAKIAELLKFLA